MPRIITPPRAVTEVVELSGSSRPNEAETLRHQRVFNEDIEDESNFFYARYEPKPSGGYRRFRVDDQRTAGEVLADMELDGYQYALIEHGSLLCLLRRQGDDYDEERRGSRTLNQGRVFALRGYLGDSDLGNPLVSLKREGARKLAEVKAFFKGDESPMVRGRKLLNAERKLQCEQYLPVFSGLSLTMV
ncbi:hypothetical protein P7C71_g4936, partial [Lecanoromycetidae sp. Uapishka_2]